MVKDTLFLFDDKAVWFFFGSQTFQMSEKERPVKDINPKKISKHNEDIFFRFIRDFPRKKEIVDIYNNIKGEEK